MIQIWLRSDQLLAGDEIIERRDVSASLILYFVCR